MSERCSKCNYEKLTTSLRQVRITVGWPSTQLICPAPTKMCARCGHIMVAINWEIGEYLGLEPVNMPGALDPEPRQQLAPIETSHPSDS